VSIENDQDRVF